MDNVRELLDTISIPPTGMLLKKVGPFFWGKSSRGDIVYGVESNNKKLTPLNQTTKYLQIFLNTVFEVTFDGKTEKNSLSLVLLKKEGMNYLDVFIRLTATIKNTLTDQELLTYFLNLKNLFSNDSKKSIKELQGLYGELFSMVYLKNRLNVDISGYYQSEDKRKFDFSVSELKRIEIKTTTLPARIHHFKLEQLDTLRYDILVVSIMLQKDDCGISLIDLIEQTKVLFSDNLKLMLHIENTIKNIDLEVMEMIKYNKKYSENNLRIYKAINVPRIQEKTMDGVFNVEFDSDLSSTKAFDENGINEWIIQ